SDGGWRDIIHPQDRVNALSEWKAAIASGGRYETEYRIRRSDGKYCWHLVRALAIPDDDGAITRWIGTNTDIDEQKLSEVQTIQDRDRLWNLSQDLMLVCDFQGRITAINPSALRLLGWSEDEMLGQTLSWFIHPDDVGSTQAEMAQLSRGASTLAFENRYRRKDGGYCLLDWTAVPDQGRVHAVGRDITQERRLARERERIWSLSPVVQLTATRDDRVASVNPAWTQLLGWRREETVGRRIDEFTVPNDLQGSQLPLRRLLEALADGVPVSPLEAAVRTRQDEPRHVEWTSVMDGDMLYGFGRDITAEKTAAQALASSEAALRQAQKMEAIGQLTGGIAHDFNNLLQVIGGSLQLLAGNDGNDEQTQRRLQNAMEGVARGSRLAAQLLAFGRRQPLAPKVVNLGRLIGGMDEMLRHALGEGIRLETSMAPDLWNTLIDRSNLENALLNLAINARDAMDGHGTLSIRVCNADPQDHGADDSAPPRDYVLLSVTDTGIGIPPDLLERVFDPFFSTKPEGKGSGLGLSMVYGFVKQSGGQVRIDSMMGQGTTITLFLPRAAGAEDMVDDMDAQPVRGGSETILVAEDDPGVRQTVVDTLTDLGYHVLEAVDAQSAMAVIDSGAQIDLLFTDVVMPGPMRSTELARLAVERLPGLKVLFTSGYAENAIVHEGRLDEGVELLSKPYGRNDLARKLRHQFANAAQRAMPKPAAGTPAVPVGPRPLVIVLCEDDALIRMSVADMLEDLGHTVLPARNAGIALAHLEKHDVDLLLTDVGLPDMPGTQLAEQARAARPDLPVIFATGHSAVEGAVPGSMTGLLVKPFDATALECAINAIR
ncbi:MAG: response regulator, partial [Alphaproteobacteria bacterium]|nr:response regulator [Alphaproteobacteria bacterium]